ncbi:MAG: ATP-binding protein, partial [Candidatus Micrarchaeota archaeon]
MEREKLELFNPWWAGRGVDPGLALPFRRPTYGKIQGALEGRFILALVGLRRLGKTTIMYQTIEGLLRKGIKPESILFFSFDEYPTTIDDVIATYLNITGRDLREGRVFIFLDEIQKCANWENQLKKYYDLFPKAKFILSGSESLFVRKKSKETLAGRIFEYTLKPLDFWEYLELAGVKESSLKVESEISRHFVKFAQNGGFPETLTFSGVAELREYIRSIVVDKIVYKDIPRLYHIEDPEFLITLLELVSANPGIYLDYQSLAQQFGRDRRVVKTYVNYLKESFLLRLIGNYRKGRVASLRKVKRAYPTDTALIRLFKPVIDDQFFGRIVET